MPLLWNGFPLFAIIQAVILWMMCFSNCSICVNASLVSLCIFNGATFKWLFDLESCSKLCQSDTPSFCFQVQPESLQLPSRQVIKSFLFTLKALKGSLLGPSSSGTAEANLSSFRTAVPSLFGTRNRFRGRQFFHGLGWERGMVWG